jgi:hypothetical protein
MWIPKVRRFPGPDKRAMSSRVGRGAFASSSGAVLLLILAMSLVGGWASLAVGMGAVGGWCMLACYNPKRLLYPVLLVLILALIPALFSLSPHTLRYSLFAAVRPIGIMLLLAALWNAIPLSRWPGSLQNAARQLEAETVRLQKQLRSQLQAHAFRSGGTTDFFFWLSHALSIFSLLYVCAWHLPLAIHTRCEEAPTEHKKTPVDWLLLAICTGVLISVLYLN